MEPNDQDLIQGCLKRDSRAWDVFVERFSRLIYWNIQKVFEAHGFRGRQEFVQDVFQEVFQILIRRDELQKLKQVDSLRKYLSLVACRAALGKIRSVGRYEKRFIPEENLEATPREGPDARSKNEATDVVEAVLGELTLRERACVELYYFDELTFREVGEILNITEDAACSLVRRSREKMRAKLDR